MAFARGLSAFRNESKAAAHVRWLLLLALLTYVKLPFLHGQNAVSGALTGVVTDPSGALIPAAHIELRDNAKGIVRTASSNSAGEYSFLFLPPGSYSLTVSHADMQTTTQAVDVSVGPPVTINVRLAVAIARTVVNVTGESPLIHVENGDASSTMSALQIAQVPNPGSDLSYVLTTSPGAVMSTDGTSGGTSILGMPGLSNLFTLNGMTYTDLESGRNETGATNLWLGLNAIEEATVVSNGYSGRSGTLAGAEVNYITRSGGNAFHGNALYFWNGSVLNANDWFNNANGTKRPRDNANQWAASIGGPIRKDKLFFFLDTEGLQLLIPITQPVVLPSPAFEAATIANIDVKFGATSASDAFYRQMFSLYDHAPGAGRARPGSFADPLGCTQQFTGPNGLGTIVPCAVHYQTTLGRPDNDKLFSGRLDWHARPEDSLFLGVAYSHGLQNVNADPINSLFDAGGPQTWWQGQIGETHNFGSSAVNQLVVAGWQLGETYALANPAAAMAALPAALTWNDATTFTNLSTNQFSPNRYIIAQYQASDDLVKTWGRHTWGAGFSLLRHYLRNQYAPDEGTLEPLSLNAFYQGGYDPGTGDATILYQEFTSLYVQHISQYILGFYVQDQIHARPNLTITLALRNEHPSNPVCRERCFARFPGSFASVSHDPNQPYNQAILGNLKGAYDHLNSELWAPRLSFAWQPLGLERNTVVRGGVGVFYDPIPSYIVSGFTQNPPILNELYADDDNLAPQETTSLFKNIAASNAALQHGFAAGETVSQIEAQVPGFSVPFLENPDTLLKSPRYQKWSLQVQQAMGQGTSLSVGYFGNHGIHELLPNGTANAFGFGGLPAAQCGSPVVPPCADARFGPVLEGMTVAVSNYNGLVLSFEHRFTGLSQGVLQANYTLGHAFDEESNGGVFSFTSGSSLFPQDPTNLRGSYGPAEYDTRHSFNANYVWILPVTGWMRHGPGELMKGWQISGTIFAHTGLPYTVFDKLQAAVLQANNFFASIYAVPAGPIAHPAACGKGAAEPLSPHPCHTAQVLANGNPNPAAQFVQATCETGFNAGSLPSQSSFCGGSAVAFAQGRNRFRGPGYFNTDFGLLKNTQIPGWDEARLVLALQFFNFFNHANFGFPANNIADQAFGRISYTESPPTGILGQNLGGDASPRNIQLKAELRF
jgi:hypothetical protein